MTLRKMEWMSYRCHIGSPCHCHRSFGNCHWRYLTLLRSDCWYLMFRHVCHWSPRRRHHGIWRCRPNWRLWRRWNEWVIAVVLVVHAIVIVVLVIVIDNIWHCCGVIVDIQCFAMCVIKVLIDAIMEYGCDVVIVHVINKFVNINDITILRPTPPPCCCQSRCIDVDQSVLILISAPIIWWNTVHDCLCRASDWRLSNPDRQQTQ